MRNTLFKKQTKTYHQGQTGNSFPCYCQYIFTGNSFLCYCQDILKSQTLLHSRGRGRFADCTQECHYSAPTLLSIVFSAEQCTARLLVYRVQCSNVYTVQAAIGTIRRDTQYLSLTSCCSSYFSCCSSYSPISPADSPTATASFPCTPDSAPAHLVNRLGEVGIFYKHSSK